MKKGRDILFFLLIAMEIIMVFINPQIAIILAIVFGGPIILWISDLMRGR